jgi:hypothetical protein
MTRRGFPVSFKLILLLYSIWLLFLPRSAAATELRLDDPEWLARASRVGIEQATKTADSVVIRTGGSPSLDAYVIFPTAQQLDPREYDLLAVTMRTDPRIHRLKFLWKSTGVGRPDMSYYVQQPIYRDGLFHTYLIRLDIRPSWKDRISEIALGWDGAHGLIEMKRIALLRSTWSDRVRAGWSQFWVPESLAPAMVNAIGGPDLMGKSYALLLAVFFLALFAVIFFAHRAGLLGSRPGAGAASPLVSARMPPWLYISSMTFLVLWLLYDLRETYNHVQTLRSTLRYSLGSAPRPHHYFELDDFYEFIDATKGVVPSDGSVGFFSSRPLFVKARYLLFPRPVSNREPHSDYFVVFQDPNITYRNGHLSEKDTLVSDRVIPFGRFGEDAFIFKRKHD